MATAKPDPTAMALFCREHGIRELSFLGSVFHEAFQPESNVGVLIEFEPTVQIGFFRFMDLSDRLQELLDSRVDLMTKPMLSPFVRDDVLASREVLYVSQG